MHTEHKKNDIERLSVNDILRLFERREDTLSVEELEDIICTLNEVKNHQEIIEANRRAQEEQEKAHITEVTSMNLPLNWENLFSTDTHAQGIHAESIADGLIICLSNLGKVDIEYISFITNEDCKTVIATLKGSIYQNPETWKECFYKGWEMADEYLSGNLRRKWNIAKEANKKYNDYFSENIEAIEKVLPPTIATEDIYVTLGSPWVPTDMIDDFMIHLFGENLRYGERANPKSMQYAVKHDELTGTWEIPDKVRYGYRTSVTKQYGTDRISALYILENTLNMKAIKVTDEVACDTNSSGKKRIINQIETITALEKQKKLIEEFQKWIWKDEKRKNRLETIFENKFSCFRKRCFDGSFLQFPDMNENINLYAYQKNAVARILFTPNTLLAHDVGAGKTYVMIAAGMELRRMKLSSKNMYVVPNNIVEQWEHTFHELYPNAELLCIKPKNFTPNKRETMLKKIRDEDFDGIIIAYSCFNQIPISKDYYREQLLNEQSMIEEIVYNSNKATYATKRKQKALQKALAELNMAIEDMYDAIYFDNLGITRLFVDEAHNFKNVLGISSSGSKKCDDMMNKVRIVQKKNDGGGVVFATGTPITNSITDAFIMQKYLQSGELAMLDLQSFDSWIGMFAERNTELEIDVDTNNYRMVTRFSKFHNLPELTVLLSSIADFHKIDLTSGMPQIDEYQDAIIGKTEEFKQYLNDISYRAELVRRGAVNRSEDNMLKITTDGRKAALDMRLVDSSIAFTYQSKVARCVENAMDIYCNTYLSKSAQIIFCDISTPKKDFNIYDELKKMFLTRGIPKDEIMFIHEAKTDSQRNILFKKVRDGDVRILIGSTFKLGLGVNIQDRLIALHHIDVPWRPADMMQREGRILRQGNVNSKVKIFRYITEGSFDAYSWQLLETKQRFITTLLTGSLNDRSGSDIDSTILNYAEIKALAVGNPILKERVETANELTRYIALQRKEIETRNRMEKELFDLPQKIWIHKERIAACRADVTYLNNEEKKKDGVEERKKVRKYIHSSLMRYIFKPNEKNLMVYRGFELILPANMMKEKPHIWLKRKGKYHLELGDSEVGNLKRIDNFLDDLEEHLKKLKETMARLKDEEGKLQSELTKKENFSDMIEKYKEKLKILDKKLGVDKNA